VSTASNIEAAFPLSPLQQGMLFHSLGAPGTGVYVLQARCELHGAVDAHAFYQAWQRVLDRHQALRAAFVWEGVDEPVQVIGRRVRLPFHVYDWRGVPAAEQRLRLDEWTRRDRAIGFTLSRAPLMRVVLVRLEDERYEVLWTHHHIIADGWSRPVLLDEVFRCYRAFAQGRAPELPPARAYREYITRLPRDLVSAEAYWRAQLADVTQPTPFGVDRSAAARVAPDGYGRADLRLSEADTIQLESWARRQALSLGSVIAAAWALVLSRYSRENDVVFGVTVSGRSAAVDGIETLVGLCINTLPLRVHVRAGEPLVDWLRALQRQAADLREFEHAPLAKVQQWSGVPRGLPLFDSIVVFENFPVETAMTAASADRAAVDADTTQSGALDVRNVQGYDKTNYALTLIAAPGRQFSLLATYDPARFETETVERLLNHVAMALRGFVRSGEAATGDARRRTVGDVDLLTADERTRIVADWNATAREWRGPEESLVAWLDAQVARTPHADALWAEDGRWSYAVLHTHANQIARRLRRLGVGAESRVGVWMSRSRFYVAAMLGAMKAGAAYVPLDASYPAARLAFQVADADVGVVLTERAHVAAIPEGRYAIEVVDDPEAAWRRESADPIALRIEPEQLAYVIYTSGSTGQPKGAMNSHRGILNRLRWMQSAYGLTGADRVLQKTSCSFDVSVWELFWPLGTGAAMVLAKPGGQQDPLYLADLMARAGVTVAHFVPAMLDAFVTAGGFVSCAGVRLIVCSGEALPGPLVGRCLQAWPGHAEHRRLENLYGPTEAAVDVSFFACTRDASADAVMPIGRPVANTELYVLDATGQPAPVGVMGELHIGGVQVGRGYWQRADLTADRFIPDAFGPPPGRRLYRTGDLARTRADGVLEYVGRCDHQVKLRGNRIELGEIEAALRAQDGIRDAVVLLREDAPGERRLVAYVVTTAGTESVSPEKAASGAANAPAPADWPADAVQQALRARLPEYMVPAVFVRLDALPLSPNGKVDRRKLPAPSGDRPRPAQGFVAPRTEVEATFAQIWSEVLRLDSIGVRDNFFALGGDSMRIIQVQAKARERTLAVSIEQLMRYQTIEDLARQLAAGESTPADITPVLRTQPFDLVPEADRARLPREIEDAYPLTELQAGMLFHSELSPGSSVYHDALTFHLRVGFDADALRASLADVMTAHPVLRTSVQMSAYAEPLQLVHRVCDPPLHIDDWRGEPADEQDVRLRDWFATASRARWDWTQAPLFRLHVHRRTDATLQVTLLCHHAILDGWSVATFLTELFQSYLERLRAGRAPAVQAPRSTFRDFVALERAATQDAAAAREYWLRHLADHSPTIVPRWPSEEAAGQPQSFGSRGRMLPADVSAGLARAAERASVPLKSVLLAGHVRVLAFVCNQPDVVSGVVSHGRAGDGDGDRVLGLFLTTMPMRCVVGRGSWIDLARRVFEIDCGHMEHRHFPMAALQRALGGQPLFDAAFNFMHFHVYQALAGVQEVEVVDGNSRTETNFPLVTHGTLHGGTGAIELRLDADLTQFPPAQLERLLDYYERAYAAMAADPEASCRAAALMSDAERAQVVDEWNATETPHRLDVCIQDLIREQVERTPSAAAVVADDRELTYAELWHQAGRLARALRRLGVTLDACVGLCMPRTIEMTVAVLGTLRAGAAYVPFDPAYPRERTAMMAEDADVRVLLTTRALAPRFEHLDAITICLDDEAQAREILDAAGGDVGEADEDPRVDPRQMVYVMYTSGSTGRPKGIGLTHLCLTNLIEWHLLRLGGGARTLQFASLSFDVSPHEMAAAWCSGGTLYLVPDEVRADSEGLARYLQARQIEKAILPVVVLQQLAEHCGHRPELFASLRQVITTGEQLRLTQPVIDLLATLPECQLHNHYGPAETHVVTATELTGAPASWPVHPPIGRPIDNTQIYLLDPRFQPVPVGTPGELYIGGVGLARGYYRRPDLTAERFVPDPIACVPGQRAYRTGDLARWLPDGEIEFLGRIDHQIKIRGYRIELSEVEAAVSRHPGVRDAIVIAREFGPQDTRLVAYVIPGGTPAPSARDLRAFVAQTLPEYMVPAAFETLDAFPLTPNGKIDRRKLPAPDAQGASAASTVYVAPRTPGEQVVAGIFGRVLHVEQVGVDDHFFERGGHSLLATQAIVRVREAFGLDVPLRALFERPTVAGMVTALGDLLEDRQVLDEIASAILEVEGLSDAEVAARLAAGNAATDAAGSHASIG